MTKTFSAGKNASSDSRTSEPKGGTSASAARSRLGPAIITLDDIRIRAYSKWLAAGSPDGDSSRFWLEAEQELLQSK
jgi:Protein of unknown function (DUF2934)